MVSVILSACSPYHKTFKIYFKLMLVWKQHELLYLNSSSAILFWLLRADYRFLPNCC